MKVDIKDLAQQISKISIDYGIKLSVQEIAIMADCIQRWIQREPKQS